VMKIKPYPSIIWELISSRPTLGAPRKKTLSSSPTKETTRSQIRFDRHHPAKPINQTPTQNPTDNTKPAENETTKSTQSRESS